MSIDAYCTTIQHDCDALVRLWFVLRCEFVLDIRPSHQAYLTGRIEWFNGSQLHWTEFIDASSGAIEKLRYSYHLQNADKHLVFRYDNARHQPALPYREHKHIDEQTIIVAAAPTFQHVVEECMLFYQWI
jgi:hypothetical protein